mmetsp:Transcript_71684/g.155730  ORF Transcript_71684/g.155730 Transcript_71684/m.155730 type:complete len:217 (+) Transcript_71684:475-1125(+)
MDLRWSRAQCTRGDAVCESPRCSAFAFMRLQLLVRPRWALPGHRGRYRVASGCSGSYTCGGVSLLLVSQGGEVVRPAIPWCCRPLGRCSSSPRRFGQARGTPHRGPRRCSLRPRGFARLRLQHLVLTWISGEFLTSRLLLKAFQVRVSAAAPATAPCRNQSDPRVLTLVLRLETAKLHRFRRFRLLPLLRSEWPGAGHWSHPRGNPWELRMEKHGA